METAELWKAVVDSWDYEESKKLSGIFLNKLKNIKAGKKLITQWMFLLKNGNL